MFKEDHISLQGARPQFHCIALHPCVPQLETRCVPVGTDCYPHVAPKGYT